MAPYVDFVRFSGARIVADALWAYTKGAALMATLHWAVAGAVWGALVLQDAAGASEADARWHDRAAFVLGTLVVHESLYVGMNGFFYACDAYGWMQQFKLPRRPAQQPSAALIRRTLMESVVNHLLIQPLTLWFLAFPAFECELGQAHTRRGMPCRAPCPVAAPRVYRHA